VNYAKDQQGVVVDPVEDQVPGEPCDADALDTAQLNRFETAWRSGTGILCDAKQRLRYCTLPAFCQADVGLFLIPDDLLENIVRCGVA
jgi:hypothetical protein